jgi:hypothetical protein
MKLFQIIRIFCTAFIILYFLEVKNVNGQSQADMTDYLRQRFIRYCEMVPREEIFVSTDREEYIAGEEIWFNIWLVNRQISIPSSESKIVYLELLNPENRAVAQKRIRIDNGSGHGQIELPDTLSAGTYTIRAYTNWMKNFLPHNCFTRDISIYNAFRYRSFKKIVYLEEEIKSINGKDSGIVKARPLITLKVNNLKPDTLEIFVNTDDKYISDNNNISYLFIQTHGVINYVGSERMTNRTSIICIPKKLISAGINQITFFDSRGKPVCERYIFTPDTLKVAVSINSPDSFSPRNKVSLELNFGDSISSDLNTTDFSISVAPVTGESGKMDLNDYMIFGSEFGLMSEKIPYGQKINELPPGFIDSILLNIKSNWIDWNSVLSDSLPGFKFRVEKEDHYISGLLLTGENQLAYPGEFVLLSTPGKIPLFKYATTSYEAKFSFNIKIADGIQDILIQPDDISKKYKIYLESSFSDQYLPTKIRVDSVAKPVPSYISKMGLNYQVGRIYGFSSSGTPSLTSVFSPSDYKRFYGKPDAEILLKDWVKLPLMDEVFFEIVPHAKLKKKGSVYEMSIVDPLGKTLYDAPPVMMIDGVIIKDPGIIASLNPEYVEKIDVIKEQYMVGDYLFNGIVNIISKSGDFGNIPVHENSIRMQYSVIDKDLMWVSPDYLSPEAQNSREPDFRNTLYWNPSIKPGKDGKAGIEFWTSDIKADYEIKLQGITSGGKTVSFRKVIKVK